VVGRADLRLAGAAGASPGGMPMTPLEARTVQAFAQDGPLARDLGGHQPRQGQCEMALAVAQALERGQPLVVEAGPGVGKTLAYLVPLLLGGARAWLSTATQALQEQLFLRDIPALKRALGLPVRVALLKGRDSYVCLHRAEQAWQGQRQARADPALAAALEWVLAWAGQSLRGDLAEIPGLDPHSPLRPLISSTAANCLGSACPQGSRCHVNRARAEALAADWVVVNHHLLLVDLDPARPPGVEPLLAPADMVVVDEAHHLPDTASGLLGRALGSAELQALARDLGTVGGLRARGMQPWAHLALLLEQSALAIGRLVQHAPAGRTHLRWADGAPLGLDGAGWRAAASAVGNALALVERALAATAGAAVELAQLHAQLVATGAGWSALTAAQRPDEVRWLERDAAHWRVAATVADPAAWLGALPGAHAARVRSWVFTSATLGSEASLAWFTRRTGLAGQPGLQTLRLPSPFDHQRQAALYIPPDLPEPGDPAHTPALAEAVAWWASRLGGRTLVLTTTLRAARRLAAHLQWLVDQRRCAPLAVLDPGRQAQRAVLARFRAGSAGPAVLVASMGFWEGVDLPGDVLQLLVIDKLPFAPPDDPLVEARTRASEAAGRDAFTDVLLPDCAQALQQGAGRLIRSATDRGVLVIADRRLLTRSYASVLMDVLPPMRRLVDEDDMALALDALLTRVSTTDRSNP
jgi:ATP-dependent DNA helicase DinG